SPSTTRLTRVAYGSQRGRDHHNRCLLGVPAHICAVGLYCKASRAHLRLRLPRVSCNQASLRGSCPKGVTIPNADAEKNGSIGIAPRIFEKKTANPKPVSREDILATQDVYDKIISIENFPFNDINLFKST
ncbi:MAG: hypothetical protein MJZ76_10270, partial [Bacteroidales bacterium]|nr:hypothetical protein [Bacteroidales bacterium]